MSMKEQRDTLIDDIAKLREECDKYKNKWNAICSYVKTKTELNPRDYTYIALQHRLDYINENMEGK